MNATVIAINHALGAFVVELDEKSYVVLETTGQLFLKIGETVSADWQSSETISVQSASNSNDFTARVQNTTKSRGDAIGSVSLF